MEPMTLGSPSNSPSGSPNVGYLPPFLLGEITVPVSPRPISVSPTKGRSLAFGSPTSPSQTSTPDQKLYKQNISTQSSLCNQQNLFSGVPTSQNLSYSGKSNGPPIEDLYDTIKSNEQTINKSIFHENTFSKNSLHSQQIHFNNQSLTSWQDGCNDYDEHWVTVFGFPANAANTVLARFSHCGAILDKQYPTQGNWAHIRYATRAEKERALAQNGRQVLPGVMVGVIECKDPPQVSTPNVGSRITSPDRSVSGARSLCPNPLPSAPAPQRSNGLVSKALDYVFGW
ncbi:Nucleoporin Nup35 [Eumeta japonica]|uniref:Nucleoporin NUP35 n=1 Tax=Eumeta variegata TaxID=151549 RepID=A0A4C1W0I9_EUMVA|nr:Nucleoporin Nup35 [Eumeta japonica]